MIERPGRKLLAPDSKGGINSTENFPRPSLTNATRLDKLGEKASFYKFIGTYDADPVIKSWIGGVEKSEWMHYYRRSLSDEGHKQTTTLLKDNQNNSLSVTVPNDSGTVASTTLEFNVTNHQGKVLKVSVNDQRDNAEDYLRFETIFATLEYTDRTEQVIIENNKTKSKAALYVLNLLTFIQLASSFEYKDGSIVSKFPNAAKFATDANLFNLE